MNEENQDAAQLKLRLDMDLKTWLKVQAAGNRRTLNQEIAHRLEASRKQQEAQHAAS